MDTMTMTKTVGAFCGALLIFLLGAFVAEKLYHTGGGHGHGDDHHQAYTIETGGDDHGGEEVAEVSFEELYATADAGKGERVYSKCRACHKLEDGANATGPTLYAVVDRPKEAIAGFNYSGALGQTEFATWSPEALDAFLEDPKGYAPGTSMSFAGLGKPEDRANLIAYLATIN